MINNMMNGGGAGANPMAAMMGGGNQIKP